MKESVDRQKLNTEKERIMENFCMNCKKPLEDRPHRRTPYCVFCYSEKRREDIYKNVNRMRGKMKAAKPRKIEDEFLFWGMRNFRFLGYKISDWDWDNLDTNSGFIELQGIQKFNSKPSDNFCEWNISYPENGNTRINYIFSEWHSSDMWLKSNHGRCRVAMHTDLQTWQIELIKEKFPEYKNTKSYEILNMIGKKLPMPEQKTRTFKAYADDINTLMGLAK